VYLGLQALPLLPALLLCCHYAGYLHPSLSCLPLVVVVHQQVQVLRPVVVLMEVEG
jgi:hypothetical protein